jgi:hypothetical protein
MCHYIRTLASGLVFLAISGLVCVACLSFAVGLQYVTDSTPFGICGPAGSPFRILVILGLILASPILGIRAGVVAVRHVRNWQKWQV